MLCFSPFPAVTCKPYQWRRVTGFFSSVYQQYQELSTYYGCDYRVLQSTSAVLVHEHPAAGTSGQELCDITTNRKQYIMASQPNHPHPPCATHDHYRGCKKSYVFCAPWLNACGGHCSYSYIGVMTCEWWW